MPPPNTRKRPAPGSVPSVQAPSMQQPTFSTPNQIANEQLLQWGQGAGADTTGYADPNAYNLNNVAPTGMSGVQYQQSVPATSTQLARRPMTRQLVTAPRTAFDNSIDPWGQFGEESILDTQNMNGLVEENDNIELLEERAAAAKRDAQSKRKQIPPFVQKLSSFLDESKNTDLIRWSDKGDSFIVLDEDEFAKTLIPELFKHNNYASFVRQLNMYGFHKRVGLSDNSMKASERKNKSPSEYYNPYFKRGYPNLLWLINKPKGGTSQKKSKGTKVKNEEGGEGESDDEIKDVVDESYGHQGYNNSIQSVPRAISAAPESGPLQRREIAVVQSQLAEIQKQQNAISNAISRLRKDHNQLYQQAVAFQTLHDRHESSINAILTFLATVYNRSLDGQGPQNIAQMFANVIPQDQQHQHHQHSQGNVVDIGEVGNQQHPVPGSPSPHRRQRLLLGPAPSTNAARASTLSPADTSQTQTPQYSGQQPPAVEELFDTPADKTQIKMELDQRPQQTMLNIINSNNARRPGNTNGIEFPEMLSRYENANGKTPLTSEQRNDMLNIIANSTSAPGSNNALVSPNPPQPPSLDDLAYSQAELDELMRLQQAQDENISKVQDLILPLSPSGTIPGLTDNVPSYFPDGNTPSPGGNIDLDQFLDSGAYYNSSDHNDFNYNNFSDSNVGAMDSKFDFNADGIMDEHTGRITEAAGSSKGTTPEPSIEEASSTNDSGQVTPIKRRRKI
ncbi:hypothetical protein B7463_g7471, partial [Scytalidium lignicola]